MKLETVTLTLDRWRWEEIYRRLQDDVRVVNMEIDYLQRRSRESTVTQTVLDDYRREALTLRLAMAEINNNVWNKPVF